MAAWLGTTSKRLDIARGVETLISSRTEPSKVVVTDSTGQLDSSVVTLSELALLSGVSANVQSQFASVRTDILGSPAVTSVTLGSTTYSDLKSAVIGGYGSIAANVVDSITDGESKAASSNAVYDALELKQNTLTFNSPSSNNANPSTSAQINSYISTQLANVLVDTHIIDSATGVNSSSLDTKVVSALLLHTELSEKHPTIDSSNRLDAALIHDGTVSNAQYAKLGSVDTTVTSGSANLVTSDAVHYAISNSTPPTASISTLGVIKIGSNLSIDANGALSAQSGTFTPSVSSSTAIQSVGGLPTSSLQTASDITNKTFSELFNVLLFPTQFPTKTNPTISASGLTNNAVVLFNSTQSYTVSYTASPGKITLSGVDQQYDASGNTVTSGGVVRYTGTISSVVVNDFDGNNTTYTEDSAGGANKYSSFSTVGNFVITNYDFNDTSKATNGVELKLTIKWNDGPTPIDSTGAAFTSSDFPYSSTTGLQSKITVYPAHALYQGTSTTGGYEKMKKNATQEMSLIKHSSLNHIPNNNDNLSQFIYLNYTHVDGTGTRHRFYLSQLLFNYWTTTQGKTLQIYGPNGDGTGWSAEAMANFSTDQTEVIQDDNSVNVTYVRIEFTSSALTGPKKYKISFI
jgi:hypothetical protein